MYIVIKLMRALVLFFFQYFHIGFFGIRLFAIVISIQVSTGECYSSVGRARSLPIYSYHHYSRQSCTLHSYGLCVFVICMAIMPLFIIQFHYCCCGRKTLPLYALFNVFFPLFIYYNFFSFFPLFDSFSLYKLCCVQMRFSYFIRISRE